jgi:hypothetical protein
MGPGNQDRVSPMPLRALAGIETGILGGSAMFGWLAISSVLDRHSAWIVPNLLGSTLSGRPVLHSSFGWTAVSGLGLHLFVAGLVGMLFGIFIGDSQNRLRVTLLGVITGLVWYYFSQILFWRKLGTLMVVYSPPRPMLLGHFLFGLVLAWFPSGLRSLRRNFPGLVDLPVKTGETAVAPDAVE